MITIKPGRWEKANLLFFTYTRVYIRGRPTPFCIIKYRKEPATFGSLKQEDWSFLERVRFMFSYRLADLEYEINRRFENVKRYF
jgi:hypothetical protein